MPIMLAITVAAFLALAWAVISIVRHVRGVRAQRRKAIATARHEASVVSELPLPFTAFNAPEPGQTLEPAFPSPPPPPPPAPEISLPRFPLSSQRIRVASALEIPVAVPDADSPAPAPLRRPPASVPAAQPYKPFFSNADYGDLSDPEPSQRPRSRSAAAKQLNARR